MSESGFKDVSKQLVVKQKYNNFILKNIDQTIGINRIEEFCKFYLILISKNCEDYMNGKRYRSRVFVVSSMKVCLLIVSLRFAISGLVRTPHMNAIMCDANYLLGNQPIISLMMSICAFVILFITLTFQIQEYGYYSSLLEFLYMVKHKSLPLNLNAIHYRRFILYTNMFTKYILKQAFWPLVIVTNVCFSGSTIIVYLEPNSGFTLIGVIIWAILTFVLTIQFYAIVCAGFIAWCMETLYLKYKFEEINEKIEQSLKNSNSHLLLICIKEHQIITRTTYKLNEFFKLMIFILYYLATPALELLIYLSHEKNTLFYFRFVAVFIFTLVFGAVFTVNLMSAAISKAARTPCPHLYSFISRSRGMKHNLKVMSFIEKLSGPDIGFYCHNLFPMNSYEFYLYVSVIATNYILIMNLVKDFS